MIAIKAGVNIKAGAKANPIKAGGTIEATAITINVIAIKAGVNIKAGAKTVHIKARGTAEVAAITINVIAFKAGVNIKAEAKAVPIKDGGTAETTTISTTAVLVITTVVPMKISVAVSLMRGDPGTAAAKWAVREALAVA